MGQQPPAAELPLLLTFIFFRSCCCSCPGSLAAEGQQGCRTRGRAAG